ncbi:MAG: hypothetical protein K6E98_02280 [Lachnospiraceae bacterium]|nr:hypothetical protein [Lachnospiraceae bacterium]
MEREKESFKVWTDPDRRIVYSRGHGVAHAHEIEWLYGTIIEFASEWKDEKGFVYMAYIEDLKQVSPKGSGQYVKLHESLAASGCKCIAYIEGNSYEVSVQSSKHKQMSNTPQTENRYFITAAEGLEWFKEKGF